MMSHLNTEKAVVEQMKSVAGAETAKMMESMMGNMDMSSMMRGMGPMKMEGMMPMMMEGMGPMMKMPGAATGVVVYTGYSAGKSAVRKIFTHPLVVFSLGFVVGCYVYKYRKCIISACAKPQKNEE
jgi:hypothetical protein